MANVKRLELTEAQLLGQWNALASIEDWFRYDNEAKKRTGEKLGYRVRVASFERGFELTTVNVSTQDTPPVTQELIDQHNCKLQPLFVSFENFSGTVRPDFHQAGKLVTSCTATGMSICPDDDTLDFGLR